MNVYPSRDNASGNASICVNDFPIFGMRDCVDSLFGQLGTKYSPEFFCKNLFLGLPQIHCFTFAQHFKVKCDFGT